jgi:hypothetical protein
MEMMRVNRITVPAHLLLRPEGAIGRVHSVFGRGLNVVTQGRLIHIQWERELKSPFSLALNKTFPTGLHESIREGDEVVKEGERFRIGAGEWILYAPKEFYDPCIHPAGEILESKLEQMSTFLITEIRGFRERLPSLNFLPETEAIIENQTESLLGGLRKRNLPFKLLREFTGKLIGLGPGLTPMGDDFIIGIMGTFTLFRSHSKKVEDFFRNFREAIIAHLNATCAISREFLLYATQTCFSEQIKNLLSSFSHKTLEEEKLKRTIQSVFDFGSTSGIGNLLGISYGLRVFSALRQNGEEANG